LRTLGIEADAVLIKTGSGLDVSPHLPALNQFDHMIVRIDGDEPLWMDPTAVGFPCGILPPLCMGRRCLIIDESTTELSTTPAMTPADDVFVASTVYDLDSA